MIKDVKNNTLFPAQIIADLNIPVLKSYNFHLSGSYFFGCARPDSDYDFIVNANGFMLDDANVIHPSQKKKLKEYARARDLISHLRDLGFLAIYNPDYGANTISGNMFCDRIYEKTYSDGSVAQINLPSNWKIKLKCRDLIYKNFRYEHELAEKPERNNLWTQAHNFFNFFNDLKEQKREAEMISGGASDYLPF